MDLIIYSIAVFSPITPAEPLPPLPEIPRGSLVIVEGRAPGVGQWPCTACTARRLLPGQPIRARSRQPQPRVGSGPGRGCDPACIQSAIRSVGDILSFGAQLENIKLFIKGDLKCPIPVQS